MGGTVTPGDPDKKPKSGEPELRSWCAPLNKRIPRRAEPQILMLENCTLIF